MFDEQCCYIIVTWCVCFIYGIAVMVLALQACCKTGNWILDVYRVTCSATAVFAETA